MLSKILTIFKKKLPKTRKFIFGNYREHVLSKTICHEIEKLEKIKKKNNKNIIDGIGFILIVKSCNFYQ